MKLKVFFFFLIFILFFQVIYSQETDFVLNNSTSKNRYTYADNNFFYFNLNTNYYGQQQFYDYNNSNFYFDKKDPLFAAALSWYVPGLGLLYTENWFRGIIYYSVSNFLLFYAFSQITNIQYSLQQFLTFSFNFTNSSDQINNSENIAKASAIFLGYIGVRLLSIVDSTFTAYHYNIINEDKIIEIKPSPFIAALLSWLYPGLGQFYIKEYTIGSIFLLFDFIQKGYLFGLGISKLYGKTDINIPSDEQIPEINWSSLSLENKIIIISYLSLYLGNRLFSSILAYKSSKIKYLKNKSTFYFIPKLNSNKVEFNFVFNF